jgi:hypothetical protein
VKRDTEIDDPSSVIAEDGATSMASQLAAWPSVSGLASVLADDLGALAGCPLGEARDAGVGAFEEQVGASIALTLVDGQFGLVLALEMPRTTAIAVAHAALGADPDPQTVEDMLRELANVSGGALKRLLLADRATFTLGLPVPNPSGAPHRTDHGFTLTSSHGPIRCRLAARHVVAIETPIAALHEGQVLARDVRASDGSLLFGAGLRLTSAAIDRLQRALGRSARVEVVSGD